MQQIALLVILYCLICWIDLYSLLEQPNHETNLVLCDCGLAFVYLAMGLLSRMLFEWQPYIASTEISLEESIWVKLGSKRAVLRPYICMNHCRERSGACVYDLTAPESIILKAYCMPATHTGDQKQIEVPHLAVQLSSAAGISSTASASSMRTSPSTSSAASAHGAQAFAVGPAGSVWVPALGCHQLRLSGSCRLVPTVNTCKHAPRLIQIF